MLEFWPRQLDCKPCQNILDTVVFNHTNEGQLHHPLGGFYLGGKLQETINSAHRSQASACDHKETVFDKLVQDIRDMQRLMWTDLHMYFRLDELA